MDQVIEAYRKYKQMYVVDDTTDPLEATDDFIGNTYIALHKDFTQLLIHIISDQIMILT